MQPVLLTCARCKQQKPESEFRFMPTRNRYCSYCKSCEVDYTRQHRKNNNQKLNKKRYMKKTLKDLCEIMDSAELDMFMYELKQIREEAKKNDC